jgi:hypothetical protein
MAGVYRPRHPERTVLYRVLFHHFGRFLTEYEGRFEKECGFLRPVVKDVVEKYLDCGNPRSGFARIRCPRCRAVGGSIKDTKKGIDGVGGDEALGLAARPIFVS